MSTPSGAPDHYETLGVPRSATQAQIKKAYFSLAKKYHPDVNPGDEGAKLKFQRVADAYAVLKDPKRREQYDANPYGDTFESGGGAHYYEDGTDAYSQFREVFDEFGLRDLDVYAQEVKTEATVALDAAKNGDYNPAWEFAKKRRGLILAILLPTVFVLRFPGAVAAALRVLMVGALGLLQNPMVRNLIIRAMWKQFIEGGKRRGRRGFK